MAKNGLQKENGFQGRFERTDRGSVVDRNRELVPGNWSLVRERVLTTGLGAGGQNSELVCLQKSAAARKECKDEEGLRGRRS